MINTFDQNKPCARNGGPLKIRLLSVLKYFRFIMLTRSVLWNISLYFQWRYSIRMENLGDQAVTLRERNWRIFSLSGTLETVRGRGVVGQEPVLSREMPAFQYSSHVSLQAPSGHMW